MKTRILACFAAAAVTFPTIASAHPGHDGHELTWDFTSGFGHPFSGWDHWLAMVAVGVWAFMLGGRARWLIPATFVAAMAAAAVICRTGFLPSLAEQGIAASLLVLGLLISFSMHLRLQVGVPLVALFAAFHGMAHGAELPSGANILGYAAGFVTATAALHLLGYYFASRFSAERQLARAAGLFVAAFGLILLLR